MVQRFEELRNFNSLPPTDGKYKIGGSSDQFDLIKHLKPVFAFDFICEDKCEFSFCGKLLGASDYKKLLTNLKRISQNTYEKLNRDAQYHFHDIEWSDVTIKESDFNKCVFGTSESNGDITPYQFKVYEEARLIGFIYLGVFYLVMFDRGHNAYKRK